MPSQPDAIPAPDDVAKPPPDAEKTASGLVSKLLTKGTGTTHPAPDDRVKVNATGWTKDGRMLTRWPSDEELGISSLMPGLAEGVKLMVEGEKRRFWIPAALGYGEQPSFYGQPTGELTFDVELLSFVAAPKPPPVPEDVKAPPVSAKKTGSGLAYRLLSSGKPDGPPRSNTTSSLFTTPVGRPTERWSKARSRTVSRPPFPSAATLGLAGPEASDARS